MRPAYALGLCAMLAVAGCGDADAAGHDADVIAGDAGADAGTDDVPALDVADTGDVGADMPADVPPVDPFAAFVARFNLLETVAGAGQIREKDVSGWLPGMEGGLATAAELSRPHTALGDDAGNLYIADKDAHAIRLVAPDGVITTVAGTNVAGDSGDTPGPGGERRLNAPNGLWVRGDGTLYILDLGNAKVRRLAVDGTLSTLFAVSGGIATGRGLWVAADESEAFVASGSRVLRWTPGGGVTDYATGFSSLGNLVVDPGGAVVVTDRSAGRVYRLDSAGSAVVIAGSGLDSGGGAGARALDTALVGVRGVWFTGDGGYLLATHEGSQVWYVDAAGIIHLFLDGRDDHTHAGDGAFFLTPGAKISEARAVTMDPAGNVLVTENDFGYIRRVRRRP